MPTHPRGAGRVPPSRPSRRLRCAAGAPRAAGTEGGGARPALSLSGGGPGCRPGPLLVGRPNSAACSEQRRPPAPSYPAFRTTGRGLSLAHGLGSGERLSFCHVFDVDAWYELRDGRRVAGCAGSFVPGWIS